MSNEYYAIVRNENGSVELKHWKYLYKKKVNGKWRYYYDDDKHGTFTKRDVSTPYGTYVNSKGAPLTIKKGKGLLTTDVFDPNPRGEYKGGKVVKLHKGYEIGQSIKSWGSRTIKHLKTSAKKQIKKGKNFIDLLMAGF